MKVAIALFMVLISSSTLADLPDHYDDLIDYVQEAPDQGKAGTCLFMANTGAMELLANKYANIRSPEPYGPYDLAESYSMFAPDTGEPKSFIDKPIMRFNGEGVHARDWPFEAWNGNGKNPSVWQRHPEFNDLPRIKLPAVETIKLFEYGNRWSTGVLDKSHVLKIKEALWKYKGPILVNYNDTRYWHVVLIVGYDDRLPGVCHDTDPKVCEHDVGSFYVRDSFSIRVELRDYDWFRAKGNAATAILLKPH